MYARYKRTQGQITSKISTLKVDLNARRLLHFSQETYMKIYDKLKKKHYMYRKYNVQNQILDLLIIFK